MFTKKVNPPEVHHSQQGAGRPARRRGRPSGTTAQGYQARQRLYETAVRLIGERGYEATTLRAVADAAGVSVGLLYKYFPSKRAVVLALYDQLSAEYAVRAARMRAGKWRDRFVFALRTCLDVLGPYRNTLAALQPLLISTGDEGLFAAGTTFSRLRVEEVFLHAVSGAVDAPGPKLEEPLGRLLYLLHLAVILWWLLDRSPKQRATYALVGLLERILPSFGVALRLPRVRGFVRTADVLVREALFQ